MLTVCFTAGLSLVATSPCLLSPSTLYSPLGWGWQQDILPPSSPAIPRCLEARDPICCTAEPWLSLIFPDPDTVTVVITVRYSTLNTVMCLSKVPRDGSGISCISTPGDPPAIPRDCGPLLEPNCPNQCNMWTAMIYDRALRWSLVLTSKYQRSAHDHWFSRSQEHLIIVGDLFYKDKTF